MNVIYISEVEMSRGFIEKRILKIKKFLNIVERRDIENKTIYYLPILKNEKISEYRIKKISKKINKLLEKDESNIIALSEYLDNNKLLKNYLYNQNLNILNGRFLFKCLSLRIIEYIFKIKNIELELRRSNFINK